MSRGVALHLSVRPPVAAATPCMVRAMRRTRLAVALVATLAACGGGGTSSPPPTLPAPGPADPAPAPAPAPPPEAPKPPPHAAPFTLSSAGVVPTWMDRAADPCTDFFQYACGGFVKTAVIPPDRASWGAIEQVTKESEDFLHDVLDKAAAAKPGRDPVADKIGAYYAACMDEPSIEKAGIAPIQGLLDQIAKITDTASAQTATIAMQRENMSPFFGIGPQQDFADATLEIAGLDQAGLGLPDRKYYLENAGSIAKSRAVYKAHQERMFALLGQAPKDAKASAAEAYRIEAAIAKLQQDEVTRREPHNIYHRVERAGLEKLAPSYPWGEFLAALGIANVTTISVNDPKYFAAIAKLIKAEKPAALRAYLTWTVLNATAADLGHAWVEENFVMAKELRGVEQLPPRWRRCVHRVDADLGELLGQSYVRERFAGQSKARAVDLTKEILGAMRGELDTLAWMDDATRAAAKTKLDKMAYLVGFPDKWRAYGFDITRGDYAGNRRNAMHAELARQYGKIGKPVDHSEWDMTPPTVNAYYDPSLNQIVLPAGQLQAPFFGETFHPAVNFGSTGGGTIGHEMTHGFDDEGSQFDADGNLKVWWSKGTTEKFKVATKCIQDQYSKYEAVPKVHLDGKLTAGENIADNGGVKLAFQAYQAWKTRQKQPVQADIEGVSDDQLYFLAYGQSWCEKTTDKALETQAHTNPHSPAKWRVDGVIVNQPGFGAAYKCAAGTPMNPGPEKSCAVW